MQTEEQAENHNSLFYVNPEINSGIELAGACLSQTETVKANNNSTVCFKVKKEDITYNENHAAYLTLKAEVEGGNYKESNNVSYVVFIKKKLQTMAVQKNHPEEVQKNHQETVRRIHPVQQQKTEK